MTTLEADREMVEIIRRQLDGEERPGDAARYEALLAWRRRRLFPSYTRRRA